MEKPMDKRTKLPKPDEEEEDEEDIFDTTTPPQILKVIDPPKEKIKPLHPHLPQPPALLLMISPIRTGKSTIINNLLLNSSFFGQDFFDEVMCISPTIYNDKTSRFLKKAFDCYDEYDDSIIDNLVAKQEGYEDPADRPDVAVILDDIIGVIRREARINHLASRFRHYNIKLLLMSSQNYRKVSPVIRSNCTNMIIGSPFPNMKELGKIAEEIGDQFSGADNFLKIYYMATPNKYDFLYLDLQSNPPLAYRNFDEVIAVGGQHREGEAADVGDVAGKQSEISASVIKQQY
tara:strand:- start:475 stop:1344 length:870 start_codon:yes stop_codon:yes gene_type:complete